MRKIILVLVVAGFLSLCMADLVSAASTAEITVTVTCRMLSVGVNPTSYAFGTVNEGTKTVAASAIVVTNNGNASETFNLKLTAIANWTAVLAGVPSVDEYILGAMFKATAPATTDYIDSEDMISASYVSPTTAIFALNAGAIGEKGYTVAAAATRNLWFYFYAPSSTTVGTQQSITVTVQAIAG